MTTFLVDYENTHHHGLAGLKSLTADDHLVLFTGAKDHSMPLDTVMKLTATHAKILWKHSDTVAKNYLDIQLASYLGSLIGNSDIGEREYVIVSKDKGFQAAVDFWALRRKDITVELRPTLDVTPVSMSLPSSAPIPVQAKPRKLTIKSAAADMTGSGPSVPEATKRKVRAAVKGLGLAGHHFTTIYQAMVTAHKTSEFQSAIDKGLGRERSPQIFKALRPLFEEFIA